MLLGELLDGRGVEQESWIYAPDEVDSGLERYFAGFGEKYPEAVRASVEVAAGVEETEGKDGERSGNEGENAPTLEEVLEWSNKIVRETKPRSSKYHEGARFQCRCFAVEWRSSPVTDGDVFVREFLSLIGGDASFVMGWQVNKTRADYRVIVRAKEAIRWRDWRKKLMFGHGGDAEGVYMAAEVPRRGSEECTRQFVLEMILKCEQYEHVYRYGDNEEHLRRELDRGYARPGRRKTPALR
jgi:hypothetical protein